MHITVSIYWTTFEGVNLHEFRDFTTTRERSLYKILCHIHYAISLIVSLRNALISYQSAKVSPSNVTDSF